MAPPLAVFLLAVDRGVAGFFAGFLVVVDVPGSLAVFFADVGSEITIFSADEPAVDLAVALFAGVVLVDGSPALPATVVGDVAFLLVVAD
ncbi:MAG: hypothetical protein R3F37_08060 [Candidatus Competibacteraceae bacterium]